MSNLAFIRSVTCVESWDYYESKTDVWCFGDLGGYRYLRQILLRARNARQNIQLNLLKAHPTSMRCVILPPIKGGLSKPRVKFIERFVSSSGQPNMELVIFGNRGGYKFLSERVTHLLEQSAGDPSDHAHLDDLVDKEVVPRSVSINLRGPVRAWNRKHLEEYAGMIFSKGAYFLPADLDQKREPYQE